MIRILAVFLCLAGAAGARSGVATIAGAAAQLRALDMITGRTRDISLAVGDTTIYEHLMISVTACHYPGNNIDGDAFAYLKIRDVRESEARFEGWMIASSPALSALEHPRYDVWVLRCKPLER
ncbi:MAG: DUF2155 domain-containing protein [Rhodobacteraceae bacterium]|nr:DUF2155 domain-containing protein [Paracoccaceae bacterium]